MTGTFFTRRGFLGLSAAAVAGAGLSACTGAAPAKARRPVRRRPTSCGSSPTRATRRSTCSRPRSRSSMTRPGPRPRSTTCPAPARRCTRTSCGPSCSAAPARTCGESGAVRSVPRSPRPSRRSISRPYYEKFGWDSTHQHRRHRGHDLRRRQGRRAVHLPRHRRLVQQGDVREGRGQRAAGQLRRAGGGQRQDPGRRHHPAGHRRQVRLAHHAALRVPAGDLRRPGAARQAAGRRGELGPARRWSLPSRTSRSGRTRSGSRRVRSAWTRPTSSPWYVQGKTAYTITGPWTEADAIQTAEKDEADFGVFQFPTDQSQARHSGFVEGYMINAKTGNLDKAAELIDFIVKPETQKALKISASTVTGAEPDEKTAAAVVRVVAGTGQGAVLHDPGPGLPQAAGRPVLRHPERHAAGQDHPGRGGEEDAGRRLRLGEQVDPTMVRPPLLRASGRSGARTRRRKTQVRRVQPLAVRPARPRGVRRLPGLPGRSRRCSSA